MFPPLSEREIEEVVTVAEESGYALKCANSLVKKVKMIAKKKVELCTRSMNFESKKNCKGFSTPMKKRNGQVLTPQTQENSDMVGSADCEESLGATDSVKESLKEGFGACAGLVFPNYTVSNVRDM